MAASACTCNCTNTEGPPYDALGGMDAWSTWHEIACYFTYNPWVFSLLGSTMVGLTGIFPLWLIPIQDGVDPRTGENGGTLKILLSFAVGALLGDVFLHLLPEAFESDFQRRAEDTHGSTPAGLWILFAFLFFVIFEKIFAVVNEEAPIVSEQQLDDNSSENTGREETRVKGARKRKRNLPKRCLENTTEVRRLLPENQPGKNGIVQISNGIADRRKNGFNNNSHLTKSALSGECHDNDDHLSADETKIFPRKLANVNGYTTTISCNGHPPRPISVDNVVSRLVARATKLTSDLFHARFFNPKAFPGYLNLLMNFLDNFTHGLSVGGSFLISFRVGALSTFAILVHEIPHEVGDFAILLRSGFSRWDAARAQLVTAGGGIVGALAAVSFSGGLEERTSWILPLTAGGFIHIGLVTILPDLLKETNTKESLKQLGALLFGVIVMAALTFV